MTPAPQTPRGRTGPRWSAKRRTRRALRWLAAAACALLIALAAQPVGSEPGLSDRIAALDLGDYPAGWEPPAFRTPTLSGGHVELAGLRGRVVLVNFWATWCVACLNEMPALERLHRDYTARGLSVVGVNVEEDADKVRPFVERLGITYPIALDEDASVTRAYGVIATPSTFVVGREGRAVAIAVGDRDWLGPEGRGLIEALLAEPAP